MIMMVNYCGDVNTTDDAVDGDDDDNDNVKQDFMFCFSGFPTILVVSAVVTNVLIKGSMNSNMRDDVWNELIRQILGSLYLRP